MAGRRAPVFNEDGKWTGDTRTFWSDTTHVTRMKRPLSELFEMANVTLDEPAAVIHFDRIPADYTMVEIKVPPQAPSKPKGRLQRMWDFLLRLVGLGRPNTIHLRFNSDDKTP